MSLKRKNNLFKTVKFKITLWYAILYVISSAVVFLIVYHTISSNLMKRIDDELLTLSREIELNYNKWSTSDKNGDLAQFLQKEFEIEVHEEGASRVFFILISEQCKVLAKSDLTSWKRVEKHPDVLHNLINKEKFTTFNFSKTTGNKTRIFSKPYAENNTLIIGISLIKEQSLLNVYISVFISIFSVVLIISSLFGWFLAKRAMSGVDRVSAVASAIWKKDFSRQVPIGKDGEEIQNLVLAFNSMITRIQDLVFELKEVSDNIAHDLRTPLTRIRGLLEVTVNSNPEVKDYQEMAGEIAEECDRLIGVINTMLEITQTDSGTQILLKEEVDITRIAEKAYNLFLLLAEEKGIEFKLKTPSTPIILSVDTIRLQRVLSNLLDNAIKYTPEKGKILLAVSQEANSVIISVKDTGCGISESEQKHIYERFFRGDSSRSQSGNGLGLSLARALVKAHDGTITVESSLNSGSEFKIILPHDS